MISLYNKVELSSPLLFGVSAIMPLSAVCQQTKEQRPHILLIFTDQQNMNAMSAVGNPYLHTPYMDQLAVDGVLFTKAYCTSPVSGPSRASIVTGLMPSEIGMDWNDQSRLKQGIETVGDLFSQNGYKTVWAGKWHIPEIYPQRSKEQVIRLYGFEFLPFWDAPNRDWLLGAQTDPPLTTAVVDFLDHYVEDKPFFLSVSYHNPHDICMFPRKVGWETEQNEKLLIRPFGEYKLPYPMGIHPHRLSHLPPLPNNYDKIGDEPEFVTDKRTKENPYGDEVQLATGFSELEWQAYLNSYYRLTELVDKEIGKVIEALKRNHLYENTLIVFTSDHGDGMAAHKWAAKLSLYQESVQVPLIVVAPGKKKVAKVDTTHLVSLTDLVPTFYDYAGIRNNTNLAGRSMKKIIESSNAEWRSFVVTELADNLRDKTRKGRMVRTKRYKYSIYTTGKDNEQLFDLINDPGETINLAYRKEYISIAEQHRTLLRQWLKERNDDFKARKL